MPTVLANGDYLKITIACRVPAKRQLGLNDSHYRVKAAGGQTMEYLVQFLYNRFLDPYRLWLPTQAEYSGVSLSRVNPTTAAGPFYYVYPTAGADTTGILPLQVSAFIRKTSPGETTTVPLLSKGNGRIYVPFPSVGNYNTGTGVLTALGLQRLRSVQSILGPDLLLPGGGELTMVLRRTVSNPTPPLSTFLGFSTVTQMTSLKALASQRRRGDFGKINAAFGGIL